MQPQVDSLLRAVIALHYIPCFDVLISPRRSLELDPFAASAFFPFAIKDESVFTTSQFQEYACECASTIDFIVGSLGPDMDMLLQQLMEMGTDSGLFVKMRPEHWRVLEQALLAALEAILGDRFDDKARASWKRIFDSISSAIIKVLRPSRRRSVI